ncbi:hypothetical protein [Streptomyces sp. NPDC055506]
MLWRHDHRPRPHPSHRRSAHRPAPRHHRTAETSPGWLRLRRPWAPDDLTLPDGARLEAREEPGLLGGVTLLSAGGVRRSDGAAVRLTAVPYCVWANRRQGPMRVWIPRE